MTTDMVELYTELLSMRRELVARLAGQFDGGMLALLASVDGAAVAVEAEIEAEKARHAVADDNDTSRRATPPHGPARATQRGVGGKL